MAHYPDLSPCTYFNPIADLPLLAVGWPGFAELGRPYGRSVKIPTIMR